MNMRLQKQVKAISTQYSAPAKNMQLQRKCLRCDMPGLESGLDEQRRKQQVLQHGITSMTELSEAPPIINDVLRSPCQPLDGENLSFVETGFGHDFNHVRIYGQRLAIPQKKAILPLYDKVEWLETGHTDCDWDRNVPADEVFKPNSGNPVSKVTAEDDCTKSCTNEHEKTHKTQLAPVCKNYFECYTGAPKKAGASPDCKGLTGDNLNKCIALMTTILRYECFSSVAEKWNAQHWECQAYKSSLACAQDLQKKSDKSCSGKIGAYIYSTQKSIDKYCKSEKKEPQGGSKEPEKPPAKKQE